ncbi:hypothetical protein DM01DRAFT_1335765, partial [Hesseltinella vesiculosa]
MVRASLNLTSDIHKPVIMRMLDRKKRYLSRSKAAKSPTPNAAKNRRRSKKAKKRVEILKKRGAKIVRYYFGRSHEITMDAEAAENALIQMQRGMQPEAMSDEEDGDVLVRPVFIFQFNDLL